VRRRSDDELARRPQVVEALDQRMLRPTVFEAMRDFWWVILFAVLLGAGVGTTYGLMRAPTYTAESRMSVGRIDVSTQAIPGFAQAALTLADSYSRAIDARSIVHQVAQQTGLPPRTVIDDVSASPIPASPVVRVFATASTGQQAVTLADTASRSLISYVRTLNQFNPDSKALLKRFQRASEKLSQALAVQQSGGVSASDTSKVASARLEMQTASDLYRSSQMGQATPNTLQVLALAADADSDFSSNLQRAIFVGVIGGLLIGAGIALLLAYRN
jgi:capsular polysaccharide biosynthesis protein